MSPLWQSTKPYSMMFSSSRTLPGKSWRMRISMTSGVTPWILLSFFALKRRMKWSTR